MIDVAALFEQRTVFPQPSARERLNRLVGLESQAQRLTKLLSLLVNPNGLKKWREKHYPHARLLLGDVLNRPRLIILAGDVGSGKTELAETIGDSVARQEDVEVVLLPLSLSSRGQGKVGEMTQLISAAFDYTVKEATGLAAKAEGAVILLIDEADALAQSREGADMHHENVSGVNALIRGLDRLANARLPAAVIMCTNRYDAIDPAVRRRAADILLFGRPTEESRRKILQPRLAELGFPASVISEIVLATGAREDSPGFTYSDLTQRLLPGIILDAYPHSAVDPMRALQLATQMHPTPAFRE